jgi:hypothetical protein
LPKNIGPQRLDDPSDEPRERHYQIWEIARRYRVSKTGVRLSFVNEPGVLRLHPPGLARPEISVPASVLARVINRMTVGGAQPTDEEQPYYSIGEIAYEHSFTETRTRKAFANEPGVLRFQPPGAARPVIRVPASVVERVLRRMTVPEPRK